MTKRLRGTWHAWHFQFALSLVVKLSCGYFCIACRRPLTRRYATEQEISYISASYSLWLSVFRSR
ncbi:TPA: hypothetical protein I7705_22805 [Vibrio vulnificus]|nr:hypothetical protein [Vibrio vulnificus]